MHASRICILIASHAARSVQRNNRRMRSSFGNAFARIYAAKDRVRQDRALSLHGERHSIARARGRMTNGCGSGGYTMKRVTALLAVLALAAMSPGTAGAQTFPTRNVKLGVPFPAGGGTDLLARLIADALSKKWGQTVYVENLSGAASGNVGSAEVARAEPDGHTLLLSPPGPIAMNKLLCKSMPFDSSKWVPISVVASVPYVLAVRNGLAPEVKGLVAKAKASPGKITYASPGAGTVGHLAAKQFEMLAGIELVTVPYKGLAPALKDIVGGHVD